MSTKKVKNVLFRTKIKGNGVVNFDSSEQRFMFSGTELHNMKTRHENTNYAKKKFNKDGDKLTYKLSISSDCLRHDLFKEDALVQSPNLINNEHVLYSFIASPASLLRGYLFADTTETLKRKGALTITDATQTCNAVSYIETFSKSGKKLELEDKVEGKSDNSFFKKEVVGDIEYLAVGNIDLMGLQFVSCDKVFDRFNFNPDLFTTYKAFLKAKMPTFNSELGYYQIVGSTIEIPEYGFLIDNDNVILLVKELFRRLLSLNIQRRNSFARVSELEYKLVYDPIEDTIDSEDGWISLKTNNDIANVNFDIQQFYALEDLELAKTKRESIEADYQRRKNNDSEKKAIDKANKSKNKGNKGDNNSKTEEND